jgi:glutamate 5-kinase
MVVHTPTTAVIKLGTTSIVDPTTHLPLLSVLSSIAETCVKLRRAGHRVVIVSSGAVGVGMGVTGLEQKPEAKTDVQALAAIGQCRLMSLWDGLFRELRQPVAQFLVSRDDIVDRTKYLAASKTLNRLLDMGVIPIVNENDALSDFKLGGNDILAAITAEMVQARYLFLMTDVECLYDRNPRLYPTTARAIELVEDTGVVEADVGSEGSTLGTGGMASKVLAAKLAASVGVTTIISHSERVENIWDVVAEGAHHDWSSVGGGGRKATMHTRFVSKCTPIPDRYLRLLNGLKGYRIL